MSDKDNVVSIEAFMKKPVTNPTTNPPVTLQQILDAKTDDEAAALFVADANGKIAIPAEILRAGMMAITIDMLDMTGRCPEITVEEITPIIDNFRAITNILNGEVTAEPHKVNDLMSEAMDTFVALEAKYNVAS